MMEPIDGEELPEDESAGFKKKEENEEEKKEEAEETLPAEKRTILHRILESSAFEKIINNILRKDYHLKLISLKPLIIIKEGKYDIKSNYFVAECISEFDDEITKKQSVLIFADPDLIEISTEVVKNFWHDVMHNGADYGIILSPGFFTGGAINAAKHMNLKLVSGKDLYEKQSKNEKMSAKEAFIPNKTAFEARDYFENKKRRTSLFGHYEEIKSIDKGYKTVGVFFVEKEKSDEENKDKEKSAIKGKMFIDMSTGEIYKFKGSKLAADNYLKNILELDKKTKEKAISAIEHDNFKGGDILSGDDIKKLEKRGLLKIETSRKTKVTRGEKSIILILTDEILWLVGSITDIFGELLNLSSDRKQPKHTSTQKRVVTIDKTKIIKKSLMPPDVTPHKVQSYTESYDLYLAFEKSNKIGTSKYAPEEMRYEVEDINKILNRIYSKSNSKVKFSNLVYIPYYKATYTNNKTKTQREEIFYPISPKKISYSTYTQHNTEDNYHKLYNFIDKTPELPFLFLAIAYSVYLLPDMENIAFIFSSSLIFILLAVLSGAILKAIFKTNRKVPYLSSSVFRFGFPSLHSLTSIGTIAFVYFIPDIGFILSIALIPVGIIYIYSRIKLGVHTVTDVIGGAAIGFLIGGLLGHYLIAKKVFTFSYELEMILTILFFIFPIFSIWYRFRKIKYVKINY